MPRVFLSHSSWNKREAVALKRWLVEQEPGLAEEVFLDLDPVTGIQPGERWKEALQRSNARCEAVICLLSGQWEASHECRAEYRPAEMLHKQIFCARLEPQATGEITELTARDLPAQHHQPTWLRPGRPDRAGPGRAARHAPRGHRVLVRDSRSLGSRQVLVPPGGAVAAAATGRQALRAPGHHATGAPRTDRRAGLRPRSACPPHRLGTDVPGAGRDQGRLHPGRGDPVAVLALRGAPRRRRAPAGGICRDAAAHAGPAARPGRGTLQPRRRNGRPAVPSAAGPAAAW